MVTWLVRSRIAPSHSRETEPGDVVVVVLVLELLLLELEAVELLLDELDEVVLVELLVVEAVELVLEVVLAVEEVEAVLEVELVGEDVEAVLEVELVVEAVELVLEVDAVELVVDVVLLDELVVSPGSVVVVLVVDDDVVVVLEDDDVVLPPNVPPRIWSISSADRMSLKMTISSLYWPSERVAEPTLPILNTPSDDVYQELLAVPVASESNRAPALSSHTRSRYAFVALSKVTPK